ncbi:MAG: 50S ribosomal protein L25 [Deltaproteobacteria bacterium]|nr:50S ribosomal protein L25 [Deltaproteobacteria bacterium]
MERTTLQGTSRQVGKGHARRARAAGAVPAVLYGKGRAPTPLTLDHKAVAQALRTSAGLNVLLDLSIDGGTAVVSRFKEIQRDPIAQSFRHLDLQAIDLREKIDVEVPIHFMGKAEGVKEGGVVEMSRRTLDLRCLPTAIPEAIEVDITALAIGDSIHANDLQLPAGVEFPHAENFSIVQVVAPQKEEEVAVAAPEAVVPPGEVPAVAVKAPEKTEAGATTGAKKES